MLVNGQTVAQAIVGASDPPGRADLALTHPGVARHDHSGLDEGGDRLDGDARQVAVRDDERAVLERLGATALCAVNAAASARALFIEDLLPAERGATWRDGTG